MKGVPRLKCQSRRSIGRNFERGKVVINPEKCKGCKLCIEVCPRNVLAPSSKNNHLGIYVVEVKKAGECIGCSHCAIICPDVAIEVYR